MEYLKVIEESMLNTDAKYIAHQTNCVSDGSAGGIARIIFDAYPHADTYKGRLVKADPATIDVMGDGKEKRFVINMNSQYYPGTFNNAFSNDSRSKREQYFYKCLLEIAKIPNLESIAFPAGIGCALGGGDWEYYYGTIKNFAKYIFDSQKAVTYIYKLPGSSFEC